jgi:hypothetical protein
MAEVGIAGLRSGQSFTSAEIRYFTLDQLDTAHRWVDA